MLRVDVLHLGQIGGQRRLALGHRLADVVDQRPLQRREQRQGRGLADLAGHGQVGRDRERGPA